MTETTTEAAPASTERAVNVLANAEALYRAGDYAGAAELLAPLAQANPPQAPALRILGLCRMHQGDAQAAVQLLSRAHALTPADPWAAMHLGIALQASGRLRDAATLFDEAARALPDDPAPCINLAGALLALGDVKAALRAASDACFRAPQMAEAHYTYGLAWLAAGEPQRADQAFSAALRIAPRFVDAWVNLGLARYRLGRIEDAKTAMRSALRIVPTHRAAAGNLAAFLRLTGEGDAAEALLRAMLVRDPTAIEARLNLAAGLLQEERAAEALAILDAPLPAGGRERHAWLLQQTLALIQVGRTDEASRLLAATGPLPPDTAPLKTWREILLALARGDTAAALEKADDMESALDAAGGTLVPEHAIMARYDLAKLWSQQSCTDKAFANWQKGHALLARFQPFSRAACRDFVDANIAAFDQALLRDGPRAGNADPLPVFIVGMPRSGTTLAEQIIAAHGQAHGAGERVALGQMFSALGGAGDSADAVRRVAACDPTTLDRAAKTFLDDLQKLAPTATRVVDKMPANLRYLGLVARMLPGARIIYCNRDPRDIGLSIFTFRFHGSHGYAHNLADLGWYIAEQARLMAHWTAVLPQSILTVNLADWVEDFDATLARVLDHIGLPHDANCARFYESGERVRTVSRAQVRQPINARGLGRWKPYASQLQPMIAELEKAHIL